MEKPFDGPAELAEKAIELAELAIKAIKLGRQHEEEIEHALKIAVEYGGIDGGHHKDWVIDQMVRALTGCPMVKMVNQSAVGKPHEYEAQGESEAYKNLVREAKDGEDGPGTYSWDVGIAP